MFTTDQNDTITFIDDSELEALLQTAPIGPRTQFNGAGGGISRAHTRIIGNVKVIAKSFLARTEVAAYLISRELGWDLVPPTVLRKYKNRNYSFQVWVPNTDYSDYTKEWQKQWDKLKVFDALIINSDRHGDNHITDDKGKLWAIDNQLSFNRRNRYRSAPESEDLVNEDRYLPKLGRKTLKEIREFYSRKDEISLVLKPYLFKKELRSFWTRVEELLKLYEKIG